MDSRLSTCGGSHVTYLAVFPGVGPVLVSNALTAGNKIGHVSRGCFPVRIDQYALKAGELRVFFDCFYCQKIQGISGSDTTPLTSLKAMHEYVNQWLTRQLITDVERWRDPETGADCYGQKRRAA